jgi:Domain of unknown function (DUF305)
MSLQTELDASKENAASQQPRWNTALSRRDLLRIRKALISLAIMSVVSGLTLATAQDQNAAHLRAAPTTRNDQEFIIDSALAISTMSLKMAVDSTGDVDRDFVAMMMPHHQGAIDVARAELKYGHNEQLRHLALGMIGEREHEMSVMRNAFGEPTAGDASEHLSDRRSREE